MSTPTCLSTSIAQVAEGVPTTGWHLVGRQLVTNNASLGDDTTPDHSAKVATTNGAPVSRDGQIVVGRTEGAKVLQIQGIGIGDEGEGGRIVVVGCRYINPSVAIATVTEQHGLPTVQQAQANANVMRSVRLDFRFTLSAVALAADTLGLYRPAADQESAIDDTVRLGTGIEIIQDHTPQTGLTLDDADATIIRRAEIRSDGITEYLNVLADGDHWLEFYMTRLHEGTVGSASVDPADAVGVLLARG